MIRFRWLVILAFFLPSILLALSCEVHAQGVVYTYKVVDDGGNSIGGAVVTVCSEGASFANLPCTPKASIYTDQLLTVSKANPFYGDQYGNVSFAAPAGTYVVSITGAFSPGYSFKIVLSGGTGLFNISSYGAKCDDSTANDAALDLALADVPQTSTNNGGVIFFPGSCKFASTHFSSKNNITFRGIGGWRYIARSVPGAFLDYTGTDNFLVVTGQGVRFQDINIKSPNVLAAIVPPVIAGGNFTLTSPGSGTLASTEYFQLIYLNNNYGGSDLGATTVSNEISVGSIGTNCVTVASPGASGDADNYEVFMGAISGNERRVTAPIAIGTPVQICAAVDLGSRPLVDTSAKAAIYTTSAPVLDNMECFTGVIATFGVGGDCFIQTVGSGPLIHHSKIEGFSVGVEMGTGSNVFHCSDQSLFQNNGWDLVIGNGGGILIDNCIFQFTATGHIKLLNVSSAKITNGSYFEQNTTTQPFVELGDTTVPTINNKTVGPISFEFSSNYGNCSSLHWASGGSPIEIQQFNGFTPGSVRIIGNTFAGCDNQLIIDNAAQIATADIVIQDNVQGSTAFHATNCNGGQCGWLTNAGSATGAKTGVGPDNNDPVSNTNLVPTGPAFLLGAEGGLVLIANLPSAASSKGKWQTVNDSTTVSAEGQTCVGSSTHAAFAFSDGVSWKCF